MGSSKNKTLMLSWRNRQNWRSIGARSRLPYPSGSTSGSSEIPSQDYSTDSAYSVDGDASSGDLLPKSLPTSPPSSPPTTANEAIPESVQKFEIPRKSGNRRKSIKDLRKIRGKERWKYHYARRKNRTLETVEKKFRDSGSFSKF